MAYKHLVEMSEQERNDAKEETLSRRKKSLEWMKDNFHDEIIEAFRLYNMRVPQILKDDGKEDTTRTNICMPGAWISTRRKTSRLTAQPPHVDVRAESQEVSDWLTSYLAYQWDVSREQKTQYRHVLQAEMLGPSLKLYSWDKVQINWRLRRSTESMLNEYGAVMDEESGKLNLGTQDDMEAMRSRPIGDFSEEQRAGLIAQSGMEQTYRKRVTEYEGPVATWIPVWDWYPEPGFESLHGAAWHTFEFMRDLEWIKYFAKQTYEWEGREYPCLDQSAVEKLVKDTSWTDGGREEDSLKRRMTDAIFKKVPDLDIKLLPVKRFKIAQEFTFQDGWLWIRVVGNDQILLGQWPLPWDLNGMYPLSLFNAIPNLLWEIGDSTPRLLKHLYKLHNVATGMTTDLVVAALKKFALMKEDADMPSEIADLGLLRILKVKNLGDFKFDESVARVPGEAWQWQAQIFRALQLAEPAITNFGDQSQAVPDASKVATLGLLQKAAGDEISAADLELLSEELAQGSTIKLLMLQQTMNEGLEIPGRFFPSLDSSKGPEGQVRKRKMDPLEIQETFKAFPEMGSTLALDDKIRREGVMNLYQLSAEDPAIWNKRAVARQVAQTYRGQKADELINPEPQGPQVPQPRVGMNLSIPWVGLDPNTKAEILQMMGLAKPPSTEAESITQALERVNRAGQASKELLDPVQEEPVGVERD